MVTKDLARGSIRSSSSLLFPRADALDVYLTRDQSRTFIVDFNPYSSSTDPLLFTYPELGDLSTTTTEPVLRVIESESSAAGALPRYSHNRYPKDVVELSEGQSVAEFAKVWGEKLKDAATNTKTGQDDRCDVEGRVGGGRDGEQADGNAAKLETVGR